MQFPQRPPDIPNPQATPHVDKQTPPNKESAAPQCEANAPRPQSHVPESRYNFANMFYIPAQHVKEEIWSLSFLHFSEHTTMIQYYRESGNCIGGIEGCS